jgi:hypothetical protein
MASYYADVYETVYISDIFRFAHIHNIRLSVNNTGHDFFRRSSVLNNLTIRTHNMDALEFDPKFIAHNCPLANDPKIGELGDSVIAGDAYHSFNAHSMDITGESE